MVCTHCNKKVVDSERIVCQGFCGRLFHMICAKVDLPLMDQLGLYDGNVFWMYDSCAGLFSNGNFRTMLANSKTVEDSEAIKSLKDDIGKLSEAVVALSAKVDTNAQGNPFQNNISPWIRQKRLEAPTSNKRRRSDTGSPVKIPSAPTRTCGTKPMTDKVKTVQPKEDLLWIYLSAFDPSTEESDIATLVRECLELSGEAGVKIVKLIPKGKEPSSLSFVSFKVGVSKQLEEIALCSDSWPQNVVFRVFEERSKNSLNIVRINQPRLDPTPAPMM